MNTRATLRENDLRAKKRYGQNFLIDEGVISAIIDGADIGPEDMVLEIGPGLGAMTKKLCQRAGLLLAVEIDRNLVPVLQEQMKGFDNFTVINEDILKTDIAGICEEYGKGRPIKVVANLPYYITTPIVMRLIGEDLPISSVTIMIQKEVAERMIAAPGTSEYGALSLAVAYHTSPSVLLTVPPHCFVPRPKVTSAVVRLDIKDGASKQKVSDPDLMFGIIRASFNQRRKTLVNSLSNSGSLEFSKDEIRQALSHMGKDENIRGEVLSLGEFAELTDRLRGLW